MWVEGLEVGCGEVAVRCIFSRENITSELSSISVLYGPRDINYVE